MSITGCLHTPAKVKQHILLTYNCSNCSYDFNDGVHIVQPSNFHRRFLGDVVAYCVWQCVVLLLNLFRLIQELKGQVRLGHQSHILCRPKHSAERVIHYGCAQGSHSASIIHARRCPQPTSSSSPLMYVEANSGVICFVHLRVLQANDRKSLSEEALVLETQVTAGCILVKPLSFLFTVMGWRAGRHALQRNNKNVWLLISVGSNCCSSDVVLVRVDTKGRSEGALAGAEVQHLGRVHHRMNKWPPPPVLWCM